MKLVKISFAAIVACTMLHAQVAAQGKVPSEDNGKKGVGTTVAPPQGKGSVKGSPTPTTSKPAPTYPLNQGKEAIKGSQGNGKPTLSTPNNQGKEDVRGGQNSGKDVIKSGHTPATQPGVSYPPKKGGVQEGDRPKGGQSGKGALANSNGGISVGAERAGHSTGHAYGRNKNLAGREFGQQRADEARANNKVVVEVAEKHFSKEELHVVSAKEQIKSAKAHLSRVKKDPQADPSWIARTEATILLAEQRLDVLVQQIKAGNAAVLSARSLFGQ